MPVPLKPFGTTRREFLQVTSSGLLFSTLAARTAWATAGEDVSLTSDSLSLTLHFPTGGAAQLRSLRNPNTGFEWVGAESSFLPVFEAVGRPSQRWTSSPGARTRQVAGDRFEFTSQAENSVSASIALQALTGVPILEVQAEFHNAVENLDPGRHGIRSLPFRLAGRPWTPAGSCRPP